MRGWPVTRQRQSALLLAVAIGILLLAFGGGALTAPSIDHGASSGQTLVSSQATSTVALLDADGETVWSYSNASKYFDLTALGNGRVVAGFSKGGYTDCGGYPEPCYHTGVRIIEPDPEPHLVYEWSYPVRSERFSEVHDVEVLPSGDFLLTDMEYGRIFEVNRTTRELTWSWNLSRHYDPPNDPTRTDWLHVNDVDRIGDGTYLVSMRNANQLLVINRSGDVVEIINRDRTDGDDEHCAGRLNDTDGDGDIRCGDPMVLDRQHNPHWVDDGTVLVADSENNRVVELHRSGDGWEVAWVFSSADDRRLKWPRDADRLPNGHTLITDSLNNRVLEVTKTGGVVASVRVPANPYEAERVPWGEASARDTERYPEGLLYEDGNTRDIDGRVPVLTQLLHGARFVMDVPYWATELHVGAVLLAVLSVILATERLTSQRVYARGVQLERGMRENPAQREQLRLWIALAGLLFGGGLVVLGVVQTLDGLFKTSVGLQAFNRITALVVGTGLIAGGWADLIQANSTHHVISERILLIGKLLLFGLLVVSGSLIIRAILTSQLLATAWAILGGFLVIQGIRLLLTPTAA
jgi:hypothetical protein